MAGMPSSYCGWLWFSRLIFGTSAHMFLWGPTFSDLDSKVGYLTMSCQSEHCVLFTFIIISERGTLLWKSGIELGLNFWERFFLFFCRLGIMRMEAWHYRPPYWHNEERYSLPMETTQRTTEEKMERPGPNGSEISSYSSLYTDAGIRWGFDCLQSRNPWHI